MFTACFKHIIKLMRTKRCTQADPSTKLLRLSTPRDSVEGPYYIYGDESSDALFAPKTSYTRQFAIAQQA